MATLPTLQSVGINSLEIFRRAMKGQQHFLSKNMEVSTSFLVRLIAAGIINNYTRDVCVSKQIPYDMCSYLLDTLARLGGDKFLPFCIVLIDTHQRHILNVLLNNLSVNESTKINEVLDMYYAKSEPTENEKEMSNLDSVFDRKPTEYNYRTIDRKVAKRKLEMLLKAGSFKICKILIQYGYDQLLVGSYCGTPEELCCKICEKCELEAIAKIPAILYKHSYYEFADKFDSYMNS